MGVMAREQSGVRPNDRPIVTGLLITYGLFWIGLAIAPVDRQDWFLENLLAVALVAVLVLTYRRFAFSLPAYSLILAFLLLHAVGAHYTYSEVPFGFWLKDTLALSRNPFDRHPLRLWVAPGLPATRSAHASGRRAGQVGELSGDQRDSGAERILRSDRGDRRDDRQP